MKFRRAIGAVALPITAFLGPLGPSLAADKYVVDPEHVSVNFTIQHMKWAKYQGTVRKIEGEIYFDKVDVSKSSVKIAMTVASIDTLNVPRDTELQGIIGFEFPNMTFESTGAQKTGDKTGTVTGNFSMAGVVKPLTLDVIYDGEGVSNWDGRTRVGFSATGALNTNEFGLTGLAALDIGPELRFTIEVEGYK